MRNPRTSLALATAAALASIAPESLAEGLAPAQVIRTIKAEINAARTAKTSETYPLKITAVDVSLTAVIRKDAGGALSLEIPIFEAGGGLSSTSSHKQVLVFKLLPLGTPEEVSGSGDLGLARVIEEAKIALTEAARGRPRFGLNEFVFDVEFELSKTAEGGMRFYFVEADASHRDSAAHRVTIYMEPAGQ